MNKKIYSDIYNAIFGGDGFARDENETERTYALPNLKELLLKTYSDDDVNSAIEKVFKSGGVSKIGADGLDPNFVFNKEILSKML